MSPVERAEVVQRLALEAGFERVGIARAEPIARAEYVREWLERGYAGEMAYLRRWAELRIDPGKLLAGARSMIVVAHQYYQGTSEAKTSKRRNVETSKQPPEIENRESKIENGIGRVAQYAWGRDYHRIIRKKLHRMVKAMRAALDEPFEARVCVDTAPLIEREFAALAGVGWIGKNTLVLHQDLGSFFFLGEVITTLDLFPSEPATDHCGSCTRCLDACPTQALTPYQMDATRCISYLTIEHRSEISAELQPLMGEWVYGCDICQEVCPYNQDAPLSREPAYASNDRNTLTPAELMTWTADDYQKQLTGSAMKRATLNMLKRNASIAIHNSTRRRGDAKEA